MNLILFQLFSFDLIPAVSNRAIICKIRPRTSGYVLGTFDDILLQREEWKTLQEPAGFSQHKFFTDLFE